MRFTKTESAIVDYLYNMAFKGILPLTINSPDVTWIWTMLNGKKYGITNAMAQTICCISERCQENGEGGTLEYVGKDNGFIERNRTFYIV